MSDPLREVLDRLLPCDCEPYTTRNGNHLADCRSRDGDIFYAAVSPLLAAERERREEVEREMDALRRFARVMFDLAEWPDGGDIDMFAFQDAAEANGLLHRVRVDATDIEDPGCVRCSAHWQHDCLQKAEWLIDNAAASDGKEK